MPAYLPYRELALKKTSIFSLKILQRKINSHSRVSKMYKLLLTPEWVRHCRTPSKSSPERPYCTDERGKTGDGSAKSLSDQHRQRFNFALHSSRLNILGRHWSLFSSFMAYVSEGTTSSHNRFPLFFYHLSFIWVSTSSRFPIRIAA